MQTFAAPARLGTCLGVTDIRTDVRHALADLQRARAAARACVRRVQDARDDVVTELTLPAARPASLRSDVERDTWRLHVAFARGRSDAVRTQLVHHYDANARQLARRFYRNREPLDDLVQVAREALLLALERFDPSRSLPFPSFANPTIAGSLKRYYRDSGWSVRVPRRVHDLSKPVRDMAETLSHKLGRAPTVRDVAAALAVGEEEVLEALAASEARYTASLDSPVGDGTGTLGGSLGGADPGMAQVENRAALRRALATLPLSDRDLLDLYFGEELTQSEIARRIGVSQMQVSRLLASAIRRLRSRM